MTIDQLWVNSSQGKFGLSLQKRIYLDAGQNYQLFSTRVGWRTSRTWLWWEEMNFSLEAPVGHLPVFADQCLSFPLMSPLPRRPIFAFVQRLVDCERWAQGTGNRQ